jgi:Berberine and berberine like
LRPLINFKRASRRIVGYRMSTPRSSGAQLALGLRTRVASWISIRSVGGAVNDLDAADTAYAHRHQTFNISSVGRSSAAGEFIRHWDELRPHLDGLYTSFETDERPERLHDAFPGDTLAKLRQLKARYDPDNVFNRNFPIPHAPRNEPHEVVLSADRPRKESE